MSNVKSASDLASRASVKGKGKANVTGAIGAALATVFIAAAEKVAAFEEATRKSMKERLADLIKLGREDHLAFRATLKERREQVDNAAKAIGQTLAFYRAANPSANSVYTTISLWLKMSEACETGWKPDLTQAWSEISGAATQALQAKATPSADVNAPQTANPTAKKAGGQKRAGRPATSGYVKAVKLLESLPLQELEQIAKWLNEKIAKAQPSKSTPLAPVTTGTPTASTAKPVKAANEPQEKAVAADGKAKRKGRNA